ncbi:MAG: hypothetical protein JO271_14885 [Verrucomicrobia bacterium]|nr:hypothetical protein [Verrucomicrobiota bacterium]MBV9276487.1 hypothetical protein [Verrucomicrobiota bacterium]
MRRYEDLGNSRFIIHKGQTDILYDSRHRIIKTRASDGAVLELLQERRPDGSYANLFLRVNRNEPVIFER